MNTYLWGRAGPAPEASSPPRGTPRPPRPGSPSPVHPPHEVEQDEQLHQAVHDAQAPVLHHDHLGRLVVPERGPAAPGQAPGRGRSRGGLGLGSCHGPAAREAAAALSSDRREARTPRGPVGWGRGCGLRGALLPGARSRAPRPGRRPFRGSPRAGPQRSGQDSQRTWQGSPGGTRSSGLSGRTEQGARGGSEEGRRPTRSWGRTLREPVSRWGRRRGTPPGRLRVSPGV